MALSDLTVRQAKAAEKTYSIPDTDGLGLVVAHTGGKSWHLRYYWLGKQKRISLGNYPEISLREARTLRDEARALLVRGVNPHTDRKQKRHAVKLASDYTFQLVFEQWTAHRRHSLKEGRQSTLSQILRIFGKDVLPSLGARSIYDIKRTDLLNVLARIEARRALTTAEKVRTWFNQLFRYALVKVPGLEVNPASDLDVVALPKPPIAHNPFLRLDELPAMLRKLRSYKGRNPQTQLGLRLLLLTGVRTGELRFATSDQFDLERGLWIIPPEAVKQLQTEMRKTGKRSQDIPPYIVPLSIQALEIVRYLLDECKPAQCHLLAHRSDLKKSISENTLNSALRSMGYADQLTGHGIRGTLSTALNEIGYPKIWVDAQLSHADPDKVSAAYNHACYVEPRRKMMQDWADRLDLLERGLVDAASMHLTLRIDGIPVLAREDEALAGQDDIDAPALNLQRLSALPGEPDSKPVQPVSALQRERLDQLETYEAPHNLPVSLFAKLAGKSRDQINREIKAGRLLTLNIGNRGQRIPEWQLDPLKGQLVQGVLQQAPDADAWCLYRTLLQPRDTLRGRSAIEAVSRANLRDIIDKVSQEVANAEASEVTAAPKRSYSAWATAV